jgi:hypothetical protein
MRKQEEKAMLESIEKFSARIKALRVKKERRKLILQNYKKMKKMLKQK